MTGFHFGISTHLYHDERLTRDHLVEIAAHGFESVELFANPPHFDCADLAAIGELAESIRDTGLRLHSVHAPIAAALTGARWHEPLSIAAGDEEARRRSVAAVEQALAVAARLSAGYLVVHVGVPDSQQPSAEDNRADAATRSIEALAAAAEGTGVTLALEVMPNRLSRPDTLVAVLENGELRDAGICLDFGHAFLMGDLMEAIEASSGHVVTTHVHDNLGARDDHLVPFEGRIDWTTALMGMRKIGYEGAYMFELAGTTTPRLALERAGRARDRFERLLQG